MAALPPRLKTWLRGFFLRLGQHDGSMTPCCRDNILLLDTNCLYRCISKYCCNTCTNLVLNMVKKRLNEVLIKLVAPQELKEALQSLAQSRNITLSALVRLILTEYVKNKG